MLAFVPEDIFSLAVRTCGRIQRYQELEVFATV